MYSTIVDSTPLIKVSTGKHEASFALDGSLMNPLEGFYATLAACAAVYAKKACKSLGVSAAGIEIGCKPFAGPGGPMTLSKFKTDVTFPAHIDAAQKAAILEAISHCAVKDIVQNGQDIAFQVSEA